LWTPYVHENLSGLCPDLETFNFLIVNQFELNFAQLLAMIFYQNFLILARFKQVYGLKDMFKVPISRK
jgi:hypothetical protein